MLNCNLPKGFTACGKALKAVLGMGLLRNFQIEASCGRLFLTATNQHQTLTVELAAEGDQEPVLVPGAELLKILKGAKRFSLQDGSLQTEAGVFAIAFQGTEDFLPAAHAEGPIIATLDLSRPVLDFAVAAASRDMTKPTLSGVLLDLSMKGLTRLVSTDGFRLAVAEIRKGGDGPEYPRIVFPMKAITVLRDLAQGPVSLSNAEDTVTFRGEGWALTTEKIVGNYPSYEKVLPSKASLDRVYSFNREALLKGIVDASRVADEYNRNLKFYLAENKAYLEFTHPDGPQGTAMVGMKTEAEPISLVFNHAYLEDICRTTPGQTLSYACKDCIGQGSWHGDAKDPWEMGTIIMPVRFAGDVASSDDPEWIRERVRSAEATPGLAVEASGITCRGDFRQLDRLVGLTAAKGHPRLPILRMVKMEGGAGSLRVSMVGEMEVFLSLELQGSGEQGPVLVDSGKLRDALKGAGSLTLAEGSCGTPAMTFPTTGAEDFPLFPDLHEAKSDPAFFVPFTKAGLAFSSSAASHDATRPILCSTLLDLDEPGEVRLVSTDGFRLVLGTMAVNHGLSGSFLLPARVIPLLGALIEDGDYIGVRTDDRFVTFVGQGWTLTARTESGKFPSYRLVAPGRESLPHTFKVLDRSSFRKALAVVGVKADPYHEALTLDAAGNVGRLEMVHPDAGKAVAEFQCEIDGPIFAGLGFKVSHLQDLAAKAQGKDMTFHYGERGMVWEFREMGAGAFLGQGYLLPTYPDLAAGAKEAPAQETAPAEPEAAAALPEELAETVQPGAGFREPDPAEQEMAQALPAPVEAVQAEAQADQSAAGPQAPEASVLAGEPILIWRQDAKAVKALGGRDAIKAAGYKAKWEIRQSGGFTSYKAQAWYVPAEVIAELEIVPMSQAEAMAIFRERSAKAKARAATAA